MAVQLNLGRTIEVAIGINDGAGWASHFTHASTVLLPPDIVSRVKAFLPEQHRSMHMVQGPEPVFIHAWPQAWSQLLEHLDIEFGRILAPETTRHRPGQQRATAEVAADAFACALDYEKAFWDAVLYKSAARLGEPVSLDRLSQVLLPALRQTWGDAFIDSAILNIGAVVLPQRLQDPRTVMVALDGVLSLEVAHPVVTLVQLHDQLHHDADQRNQQLFASFLTQTEARRAAGRSVALCGFLLLIDKVAPEEIEGTSFFSRDLLLQEASQRIRLEDVTPEQHQLEMASLKACLDRFQGLTLAPPDTDPAPPARRLAQFQQVVQCVASLKLFDGTTTRHGFGSDLQQSIARQWLDEALLETLREHIPQPQLFEAWDAYRQLEVPRPDVTLAALHGYREHRLDPTKDEARLRDFETFLFHNRQRAAPERGLTLAAVLAVLTTLCDDAPPGRVRELQAQCVKLLEIILAYEAGGDWDRKSFGQVKRAICRCACSLPLEQANGIIAKALVSPMRDAVQAAQSGPHETKFVAWLLARYDVLAPGLGRNLADQFVCEVMTLLATETSFRQPSTLPQDDPRHPEMLFLACCDAALSGAVQPVSVDAEDEDIEDEDAEDDTEQMVQPDTLVMLRSHCGSEDWRDRCTRLLDGGPKNLQLGPLLMGLLRIAPHVPDELNDSDDQTPRAWLLEVIGECLTELEEVETSGHGGVRISPIVRSALEAVQPS